MQGSFPAIRIEASLSGQHGGIWGARNRKAQPLRQAGSRNARLGLFFGGASRSLIEDVQTNTANDRLALLKSHEQQQHE
jgi:hypothetical protein